jgi:hypothetical protein
MLVQMHTVGSYLLVLEGFSMSVSIQKAVSESSAEMPIKASLGVCSNFLLVGLLCEWSEMYGWFFLSEESPGGTNVLRYSEGAWFS